MNIKYDAQKMKDIANEAHNSEYQELLKEIQVYAEKGVYSCYLPEREFSKETITRLIENEFEIQAYQERGEEKINYSISWRNA